jgi:hypothetical protein
MFQESVHRSFQIQRCAYVMVNHYKMSYMNKQVGMSLIHKAGTIVNVTFMKKMCPRKNNNGIIHIQT